MVAHRVAWLLRVQRVRASAVLVLCFNRAAVLNLRGRLRDLVGSEMAGVTTLTFHGLALRLTGRSLVHDGGARAEPIDFEEIIREAISLLKGEREVIGFSSEEAREILTARYSHILVDEYQDIDAAQYEMVSLLAGRTVRDRETRLSIMAVGDDDQNIYRFRGANVDFIRRFHQDYSAEIHYLVENYRSSGNIIAAANNLIAHNSDRMKIGHPIMVNQARAALAAGGNWQSLDPLAQGRVQVLTVDNPDQQALVLVDELQRLQRLSDHWDLNRCAVFARTWQELDRVRSVCAAAGVVVCLNWNRGTFPGLHRIREAARLLDQLRQRRGGLLDGVALAGLLPPVASGESPWMANLRRLFTDWSEETGGLPQPVHRIEEYVFESLVEQKQARSLGDGLLLTTVHAAKGLEFDHVFVLGDWPGSEKTLAANVEEERRLYYVALSRARETAQLFTIKGQANPHAALLTGGYCLARNPAPVMGAPVSTASYTLLGQKDLYIDYAGTLPENCRQRKAIEQLEVGDQVELHPAGEHLFLIHQGVRVGRLSKSAASLWRNRLHTVMDVQVVAMVRRSHLERDDAAFQLRCYGDTWEYPLVELRWSAGIGSMEEAGEKEK